MDISFKRMWCEISKLREKNLLELENRLENVDRVRNVLFKTLSFKTVEERSNSVRKNAKGSHQVGSKNKRNKLGLSWAKLRTKLAI